MAGSCWFEGCENSHDAAKGALDLGGRNFRKLRSGTRPLRVPDPRTDQASRAAANASYASAARCFDAKRAEVRDHETDKIVWETWSLAFPVDLSR